MNNGLLARLFVLMGLSRLCKVHAMEVAELEK